ncbi:MAG TPA: hypothetical protein VJC12_01395 [Candidatus Paceibacterota bacterium]
MAKREKGLLKQVGLIMFGGGLNARHWIDEAKKAGYYVLICDGRAELYR